METFIFTLLILTGVVIVISIFNYVEGKKYRPTNMDIESILENTLNNTITHGESDYFCSMEIQHDSFLNSVKNDYETIVTNPNNWLRVENDVKLTTVARVELQSLLDKVRAK